MLDISVGRDVGELSTLLNAAIPGNDIHVRTVAELDHPHRLGRLGRRRAKGARHRYRAFSTRATSDAGDGKQTTSTAERSTGPPPRPQVQGKVVNSLIIRGLDQVSMRVTISEIRREILKQLGVNLSGVGRGLDSLTTDNPFSINGKLSATAATIGWVHGAESLSATLEAFERQGVVRTLAEPTVTAVSGESAKFLAGGTIPILNGYSCGASGASSCTPTVVQQPYGVTLNFTPVVLSQGRIQLHIATEVTDVDTSYEIRSSARQFPASAPAGTRRRSSCPPAVQSSPPASFRRSRSRRSTACPA